jgi:uncharacterized protein with PIN domain
MDDTAMMLDELENLKNTVSSDYGRRLGKMRGDTSASEDTKLCPYCGAEIPAVMGKCPDCGADLSDTEEGDIEEQQARRVRFDEGLARR